MRPATRTPANRATSSRRVGPRGVVIGVTAASLLLMPLVPAAATGERTVLVSVIDGTVSEEAATVGLSDDGSVVVFQAVTALGNHLWARHLPTGQTEMVDVGPDGTPRAGGGNLAWDVSADGRYVVFSTDRFSPASVCGSEGDEPCSEIFRRDLLADSTELVSLVDGEPFSGHALAPTVSGDGNVVAFSTYEFPPDSEGLQRRVLVRDMAAGTTEAASVDNFGSPADAASVSPDVSADGNTVVFASLATNLGDYPGSGSTIYVRDLTAGTTEALLGATGPRPPSGYSDAPSVSADGSVVAFTWRSADVSVPWWRVFAFHRPSGTLVNPTPDDLDAHRTQARVSGDGQFLLFEGCGGSLPQSAPDRCDVYLHELATGTTALAGLSSAGTQVNNRTQISSRSPMSGDSTLVAFVSLATDVTSTPIPPGSGYQAYIHNRSFVDPDTDPQDGIDDSLQPAGTPAYEFRDDTTTPATVGRLVDSAGLTGRITDAPDPADGVLVTVDPGTGGPAMLEVCGLTVTISAGSEVVLTCGSLIVAPVSGDPVEVVLDGGAIVVTVAAGSSVEIEDTAAGATLTNVSGGGVTVTVNGTTSDVPDGPGPNDYAPDTTAPELAWHNWYNSWLVGPASPTGPSAQVQVECLDDSEVTATFVVRSSSDDIVHEATPTVVPAGDCSALLPSSPGYSPIQFQWDGTDSSGSPVPDGTYPFVVRVEDAAGNAAQETGSIFVGTPVTVISPQPDDVVYGYSLDVEFTVSDPDWTRVFARIGGCASGDIQASASTPQVITLNTGSCPPDSYDIVLSGDGPLVPHQHWEQRIPIEIGTDTDGPTVTLEFPDPPASGWYTAPPEGTVTASDPSGVATVDCFPVPGVTVSGATGIGSDEATATVTPDGNGIIEVGCDAEDSLGNRAGSRGVMVRVDPDADPNVDIEFKVETSPPVAGAFRDITPAAVTSGNVVDSNGLAVTITDEPDPQGVRVAVGPGTGQATISVCGLTAKVSADSTVVFTCGSLIVAPISGDPVEVVLDGGAIVVTVAAGSSVEIQDTDEGAQIVAVSGTGVTATVNGTTTQVTEPKDLTPITWVITGFEAPVDDAPVLNKGKAGRAIPLKWHLADGDGNPVTTLTESDVSISVKNLQCGLDTSTDMLEQTFAGGSGLIHHGNGDYQLNWKTNSTWARSCKTMTLDLDGIVSKQALFTFTK